MDSKSSREELAVLDERQKQNQQDLVGAEKKEEKQEERALEGWRMEMKRVEVWQEAEREKRIALHGEEQRFLHQKRKMQEKEEAERKKTRILQFPGELCHLPPPKMD